MSGAPRVTNERPDALDVDEVATDVMPEGTPAIPLTSFNGRGRARRLVIGAPQGTAIPHLMFGGNGNGGHTAQTLVPRDAGLVERLRSELPDEVYFVLGGDVDEDLLVSVAPGLLTDGVTVHVVAPDGYRPPVRTTIAHFGEQSCFSLHPVGSESPASKGSRFLDILGAGFLLLVLSPLFLLLALLVRWKTGGPVIYQQELVGQFGRRFTLYKFRSMVPDAERVLRASPEVYRRYVDFNFKLPEDEDPRITPLGRFLRKTSLDELAQLWNVLRGDMALVGPRPVVPDEVAMYGEYSRMLLRTKPGLTGEWQVTGRSMIPYPERARLDLEYVATRSLSDDLRILLLTIPAVLRRRGAI